MLTWFQFVYEIIAANQEFIGYAELKDNVDGKMWTAKSFPLIAMELEQGGYSYVKPFRSGETCENNLAFNAKNESIVLFVLTSKAGILPSVQRSNTAVMVDKTIQTIMFELDDLARQQIDVQVDYFNEIISGIDCYGAKISLKLTTKNNIGR